MPKNKTKSSPEKKSKKSNQPSQKDEERVRNDLEIKIKEIENQLLTSLADNENLRKRFDREKEDLSNYVISNFAKEILTVLDNLERALQTVDTDKISKKDKNFSQLIEGIELTEKQIINVFEKFKIEKIKSINEKFDPNLHQAMFELEKDGIEEGTVAEVVQEGYTIGERLLRPALVGVSKKKSEQNQ